MENGSLNEHLQGKNIMMLLSKIGGRKRERESICHSYLYIIINLAISVYTTTALCSIDFNDKIYIDFMTLNLPLGKDVLFERENPNSNEKEWKGKEEDRERERMFCYLISTVCITHMCLCTKCFHIYTPTPTHTLHTLH